MHCLDLGMLGGLVVFGHPTPEYKGAALTSGMPRRAYIRQRLRSERSWGERPSSQLLAVLGAPACGLWTRWLTRSGRSKYTIYIWSRAREARNLARGVRHCGGTSRTRAAAHPRQVCFWLCRKRASRAFPRAEGDPPPSAMLGLWRGKTTRVV
jgi:hypothetical protein